MRKNWMKNESFEKYRWKLNKKNDDEKWKQWMKQIKE